MLVVVFAFFSVPLSFMSDDQSPVSEEDVYDIWSEAYAFGNECLRSSLDAAVDTANQLTSELITKSNIDEIHGLSSAKVSITLNGSPLSSVVSFSQRELAQFICTSYVLSFAQDGTFSGDTISAIPALFSVSLFKKQLSDYCSECFKIGNPSVVIDGDCINIFCDITFLKSLFLKQEFDACCRSLAPVLCASVSDVADILQQQIELSTSLLLSSVSSQSVFVDRFALCSRAAFLYTDLLPSSVSLVSPFPISDITSYFGNRILRGKQNFHKGLDFGERKGTNVCTAAPGVVVFSYSDCNVDCDPSLGYGNYVIIYHGTYSCLHVFTLYAHLNSVFVSIGDYVCTGDYIGAVGSRGNSTGPHLHFEVNMLDFEQETVVAVDPLLYLSEEYSK